MEFQELLTTYWSQVTLILIGISYFVKRIFDSNSRKNETNHKIFQQNKIDVLNRFFSIYTNSEQIWSSLEIYSILEHKVNPKELDDLIQPSVNELNKCMIELRIYYNDNEIKLFKKLVDNILLIKVKLGNEYFDFKLDKSITQKSNDFKSYRDEKLKNNEDIIIKVSKMIKKSFI